MMDNYIGWHSSCNGYNIGRHRTSSNSSITCDISELTEEAGLGVAGLLKIEGESSAELDGSFLPPLVVEG